MDITSSSSVLRKQGLNDNAERVHERTVACIGAILALRISIISSRSRPSFCASVLILGYRKKVNNSGWSKSMMGRL
mgnify:CR=1 FL=1